MTVIAIKHCMAVRMVAVAAAGPPGCILIKHFWRNSMQRVLPRLR